MTQSLSVTQGPDVYNRTDPAKNPAKIDSGPLGHPPGIVYGSGGLLRDVCAGQSLDRVEGLADGESRSVRVLPSLSPTSLSAR